MIEFGISASDIKVCAGSGLTVDICGTGAAVEKVEGDTTVRSVALRADMDGLPIPENNPHLEYKSTTSYAHMCGHDGHMVTILSMA